MREEYWEDLLPEDQKRELAKLYRDTQLPAMVYPLKFYKNHYYEACARRKNRPIPIEEEKIGYEFARRVAIKYANVR